MDPVSHVIMGRVVVAAVDRQDGSRFGPGAGPAAILGALAPDVDLVLMPFGWDIYLRYHQIGTHSILGACAAGCGVGIMIRGLARGSRLWALVAAASLAAMSHLLLDLLSGGSLALAWPLAHARPALPLVAMAEPWLITLLVAGAFVMWLHRRHMRRTALMVLLAVSVFLGAKATLYGRTVRMVAADPRITSAAPQALEARWGSWTEWNVFEREPAALRVWRANGSTGTLVLLLSWPAAGESSLVQASRSLDTVRNFLSVHNLAFAVQRTQDGARVEVLWSDVRYCRQDRPSAASIDCALWFGGVFDKDGRALMQVVHLGRWIQQRPPSR